MDSQRTRETLLPFGVTVSSKGPRLQVAVCGEVDLVNRDTLASTLTGIDTCGVQAAHVDLARLSFCDTGGCVLLARFVVGLRSRGAIVTIHGARPTLRRVLTFLAPALADSFADRAPSPPPTTSPGPRAGGARATALPHRLSRPGPPRRPPGPAPPAPRPL